MWKAYRTDYASYITPILGGQMMNTGKDSRVVIIPEEQICHKDQIIQTT